MELKERIERIMFEKNLSVEELAKEVGLSVSVLRNVLKGKGTLSKYGKDKLDAYCADNGVSGEREDSGYLKEIAEKLEGYIDGNMELDADVSYEDDSVTVGTYLNFSVFNRDAYLSILCSANGSLLVYVQCGKIEATMEAYELINELNLSQPIYKAVINEDGRLELQYSALETDGVEQVLKMVDFVFGCLFEEPYEDLLKPIMQLTENDEEL